ncbi:hypothetical protein JL721_8208 [Aureococcus anophagefferens]|nr:hypothetical protein JL721_8208 [Aureococcus anophagefferens]
MGLSQPQRSGDRCRCRFAAAGIGAGVACAFGTVRWRRHTGARRRLLGAEDVDCVAGAGWGGAKSVDRLGALQHVNHDIPAAIQTGPTKAWLLGHGNWDGHLDATVVPDSCRELDVVVANSAADRCLVVSSAATTAVPHHVTRWERSSTHATGWATISRIRESKQRMPGEVTRKRARTLAVRLLSKLDHVRAALAPVLAAAAAHTPPEYAATMGRRPRARFC